ncbi:hypothetical protein [Blautia massiliensis (ex Durand et al. 2017)]
MARSMKEVHTINYYPINEGAARRAKEMNSFSDYKEESATAEYRAMVDKAAAIAEQQKSRVDPMYHEKIDHLLDTYARKLAENMNQGFAIDARVPSVMIAGPANFPVHSKKGLVNTMRRMALCAASMLLLGCLAGCSTTPQNSQEQGNPVIKEEISQPLGGSEALGNSEDSSALSAADKEKMFAPYEQYGMTYDAVKDELTYNGNLVRWFEDYYPISNNETAGIDFLNENGTVDVYAVRDLESFSKAADGSVDPAGKLIGLKEFTQQEFDARDIEALKNSTSVAMAGTPLEDSETAKLVAEYEAFGVTYDAEKDQWYFNGEEVRYFRDVLTSNGESLTSGKFQGEMRTLGSGVGTIDIYTVRDYGHLNSEHHGTLTGIEKYSQEEFDEHTQAGMSGNQPIGNASHN